MQKLRFQLALEIVRLKDLKCLRYSLSSVDLLKGTSTLTTE